MQASMQSFASPAGAVRGLRAAFGARDANTPRTGSGKPSTNVSAACGPAVCRGTCRPASTLRIRKLTHLPDPLAQFYGSATRQDDVKSIAIAGNDSIATASEASIPDSLVIEVQLPEPGALPPVATMSPLDCVREIAAVLRMREAETAAALESCDRSRNEARFFSPGIAPTGTGTAAPVAVQGVLEIALRPPSSLQAVEAPVFDSDEALTERRTITVRAAAGFAGGAAVRPSVRLVLSLPAHLHARTLAFNVPRAHPTAGMPCVGSAPSTDAVGALKALLAARVDGGAAALPLDTTAVSRLLSAHVQPWVHSCLSPGGSEERVQALVDRVRECTGFDLTPPCAPLAHTRLGCAHTQASSIIAATEVASASAPVEATGSSMSRYFAAASTTLASLAAGAPAAFRSAPAVSTPVNFKSISHDSARVSFSLTARSLFASPTLPKGAASAVRKGRTAGGFSSSFGPLLSPQLMDTAPLMALTPPRNAHRALARFVSCRDQSRPGVDPASMDREHHSRVLGTMQTGLAAMSEQRRAEEGHMLSCTRVQPAKDGRTGGYYYVSVMGVRVDAHDYEEAYLREVQYASEYISEQASLLWWEEAEAERARRAALEPAALAVERARAQRASAARLSWWEQSLEEGFAMEGSVEGFEAAGEGGTVGSALQSAVVRWMAEVGQARAAAAAAPALKAAAPTPAATPEPSAPQASAAAIEAAVSDLLPLLYASLSGLLNAAATPARGFRECDEEARVRSARRALEASLLAGVRAYLNAGSVRREGEGGEAGEVEDGADSSADTAFSLSPDGTVELRLGEATGIGAEAEAVLGDAVQSFFATSSAALAGEGVAGGSGGVLTGIVLQLLPSASEATSGAGEGGEEGEDFPSARLFDSEQSIPAAAFAGPLEEEEETLFEGEAVDNAAAPLPSAAAAPASPGRTMTMDPEIARIVRIDASLTDGRPASPPLTADDDTHGVFPSAVPSAEEEGCTGECAPAAIDEGAGDDAFAPAAPSTPSTKRAGESIISAPPPAAAGTPGRIAPSIRRVFSPQPTAAGGMGSPYGARLPPLAAPTPAFGLSARMQAAAGALAAVSAPVLPPAFASPAPEQQPAAYTTPAGVAAGAAELAHAFSATFSARAVEALRMFDAALMSTPGANPAAGSGIGAKRMSGFIAMGRAAFAPAAPPTTSSPLTFAGTGSCAAEGTSPDLLSFGDAKSLVKAATQMP